MRIRKTIAAGILGTALALSTAPLAVAAGTSTEYNSAEDKLIMQIFETEADKYRHQEIKKIIDETAPTLDMSSLELLQLIQSGINSENITETATVISPSSLGNLGNRNFDPDRATHEIGTGGGGAGFIAVPAGYVYNPNHKDRRLHDYCSFSPDSWNKADFRGPCAIHDMAYAKPGGATAADHSQLHSNLRTNCYYAYHSNAAMLNSCYGVAKVYYEAVKAWNGK